MEFESKIELMGHNIVLFLQDSVKLLVNVAESIVFLDANPNDCTFHFNAAYVDREGFDRFVIVKKRLKHTRIDFIVHKERNFQRDVRGQGKCGICKIHFLLYDLCLRFYFVELVVNVDSSPNVHFSPLAFVEDKIL